MTQYYRDLLDRLDGGRFHRVMASPLEEERFSLSKESIDQHFASLKDSGITEMRPELIINLDETGFGGQPVPQIEGNSGHHLKKFHRQALRRDYIYSAS